MSEEIKKPIFTQPPESFFTVDWWKKPCPWLEFVNFDGKPSWRVMEETLERRGA